MKIRCAGCGTIENLGKQPSVLERFLGAKKKEPLQIEWESFALEYRGYDFRWACFSCISEGRAQPGDPMRQSWRGRGGPSLCFFDQILRCEYCDHNFIFAATEQRFWYEELQFETDSLPVGCLDCRRKVRSVKQAHKELSERLPGLDPKNWIELREMSELSWRAGHKQKALEHLRRAKNLCPDEEREALMEIVAELEKSEPTPLPKRRFGAKAMMEGSNRKKSEREIIRVPSITVAEAMEKWRKEAEPILSEDVSFPQPLSDFISSHAIYCDPRCCGHSAIELNTEMLARHQQECAERGRTVAPAGAGYDLEEVASQLRHSRARMIGERYFVSELNLGFDKASLATFFDEVEQRILDLSEA